MDLSVKEQIYELVQLITNAVPSKTIPHLSVVIYADDNITFDQYKLLITKYPEAFKLFGIRIANKAILFNNKHVQYSRFK